MKSKTNWVLQIDPQVPKTLKKTPANITKRIVTVIESLPNDPYTGDIQKMKGEDNVWRRRSGEYRIFYELLPEESIIHVFRVERRTLTTY